MTIGNAGIGQPFEIFYFLFGIPKARPERKWFCGPYLLYIVQLF
jgi:hypothetical protein